jgi:hypothetical protein
MIRAIKRLSKTIQPRTNNLTLAGSLSFAGGKWEMSTGSA